MAAAADGSARYSWSWWDDRGRGGWTPYTADMSAQLEAAFADRACKTLELSLGPGAGKPTHHVDFSSLLQINHRTHFTRQVRREAPVDVDLHTRAWCWQDENSTWNPYEPWASSLLHAAHAAGREGVTLHTRKWAYWIDFARAVQQNMSTGTERPVRLVDSPGGTSGVSSGGAVRGASQRLPWQVDFRAHDGGATGSDLATVTGWTVLQPGEYPSGATDPVMMSDLGEEGETVVRLPCHTPATPCIFNVSTVEAAFASKNCCPLCGTAYALPGPQPSGRMSAHLEPGFDCQGHPGCGTIQIEYSFRDGRQGAQHPQPGQPYQGTYRKCYLPMDATGSRALELLLAAFRQGGLFRVGSSATTGRDNTVVWAIHQKTSTDGGSTRHGWPDPEYLQRLQSECAAANVPGALD